METPYGSQWDDQKAELEESSYDRTGDKTSLFILACTRNRRVPGFSDRVASEGA